MRLKSVSVTDDSDMDDNAKQLRKTFRKPTLQQIKKAAARVILGTRDSEGRSRVNSSEFQDDMANLEGLRYKLELAKQLENSDNAKTDATNMTILNKPAAGVPPSFGPEEAPDPLKELERAKSNAKIAKEDIDRKLKETVNTLRIPLRKKLEDSLDVVCETIKQLDGEDFFEAEYLKDEHFKYAVTFLKNRFTDGRADSAKGGSGDKNNGKGGKKHGKSINSAFKRVGPVMTIEKIADETELGIDVVKEYLESKNGSERYEKVADGYKIKAS